MHTSLGDGGCPFILLLARSRRGHPSPRPAGVQAEHGNKALLESRALPPACTSASLDPSASPQQLNGKEVVPSNENIPAQDCPAEGAVLGMHRLFWAPGLPGWQLPTQGAFTPSVCLCVVPVCTEGRLSSSAPRHQILDPRHLIGCLLASCLCLHLPLGSMYVPEGRGQSTAWEGTGGRWERSALKTQGRGCLWLCLMLNFSKGLPELPGRSLAKWM